MLKPATIDAVLPQLAEALELRNVAVLQAPPGAGKTTRVPLALMDAPFLQGGKIIMLEPRRLAAVNAARYMAQCLGEEVGRRVGYGIRFERKVSSATRIEVVTEGILARRLQSDPLLEGVSAVIFDEFHERSLTCDLSLALCRDVQLGLREDLRLLVMSATLDAEPVAQLLGGAPLITTEGRQYPVEIRYLKSEPSGRLAETTCASVLRALSETKGDILVFLPGAGDIRRCETLLQQKLGSDVMVAVLYGDLPFAAQERAILPADRRKVVLATNIAETSLTIEGVRVVVDSGFSRQLRFDPSTGLNRLDTMRISAASAQQRAGRAGRVAPGVCYRLWTEHAQTTLLPFTPPEIKVSDLAPLALDLAQWGVADPASLSFLDLPPAAHLAEGRALLQSLGALDRRGNITPLGKKMAALPMHPRLSAMLAGSLATGQGGLACTLAAILSERDLLPRGGGTVSDSDLLDRLDALAERRDPQASRTVERLATYFRNALGVQGGHVQGDASVVGELLLMAYPDRVARERTPGSGRYLMANGSGARLSRRSNLRSQPFIVAVEVEGGGAEGEIHMASAVTLDAVRSGCAGAITRERRVFWDEREGRVVAREEERLGAIVLSERAATPDKREIGAALLGGILSGPGLSGLNWSDEARQFQNRVNFLRRVLPEEELPDLSDRALTENLERWLLPYLDGVRSLAHLARVDLREPLKGILEWRQQKLVDEEAPTHLKVPSGSRISLEYSAEGDPFLAVKLQEMFGLAETPRVAKGRVPVVIHLLSPARRPIQVTSDLKSFWNGAYREVCKELKGRYPKHPWPDDPWNAPATRHVKKRMS
ncbi:ATP-dependent helicase HrpB [Citrifermentans bemidjiense Bem]|uniref:ATP-dependent helicase HrpB n=1 Tax=Citrifermentans bemidjiense (strain ATCC BAA-1014 / DSM 16622 / JCM 12645 / Bem) TaxID=404380 RepID=B5E8R9_CITBB|nr:ATP-dependent helicase HrpB [Citrifermentans bemidjiense]ACH40083.1 ATP-dependent helicase HrpB [Citrifermentans bemidjiense Bem]